jgi:hypothetical protein
MSLALAGIGVAGTVVVPLDTKPFGVEESSIVRLTGRGIAGSKVTAKVVSGPAKIAATNDVSERKNGKPLIGNTIREFDIKPTGKGKVKVEITVKPPQPGASPKVTVYEFEVK